MKNKNKCFFSISLENGITITGANQYKVRHFLRSCHIACIYSIDACREKERIYSKEEYEKLERIILNAIVTINENL